MIEKKKTPYRLYITALVLFLVLSYFLSGLFALEGTTLSNLQERISYIFSHPLHNWWNGKSGQCLGLGFLIWIMFVSYYSYRYRNFQFGQEHGSEEWADFKELKRIRNKDESKNRILSRNVSVSLDGVLSNNNMFIIGSSGSYKTNAVVTPNLLKAANNYIVLDVKGELQYKYGKYLQEKGYTIRSLNLKNPEQSDRYNPFLYVEKEEDLIRLITNLHEAVKKPDAMQGEPFWDDGVDLYLQAVFYYEWLQAREEKRVGNMNNILYLVNLETQKMPDGETTRLQLEMEKLAKRKGELYPPVRDYRKLKEGATETVRSIIIMVNAMLKLCETAGVKRIFEEDDIHIRELATGVGGTVEHPTKNKIALFLVLPDNDRSYNFLISIFYTQAFDILMRIADNEFHGPLPIPVEFWMDEFYAGAKPADPDVLLGVVRSRNICMMPVLQSVSQIKTLFKNDKWETMLDNCATLLYLGSGPGALSTHKYISELLGKMTIDTRSDGMSRGRNGNSNENFQKGGRALMEPAEVKRMDRKKCLIFMEGQRPIYDDKALPFDTQEFKNAMDLNKNGGYTHPVKVFWDEETLTYHTIKDRKWLQMLSKEEAAQYKKMAETDKSIKVMELEEQDFLYLDFGEQSKPTEEELAADFRKLLQAEMETEETALPEDIAMLKESKEDGVDGIDSREKENWDLSGTLIECIERYARFLTDEEMNEILLGMEAGLSEKQVKNYFCLSRKRMEQYRKLYTILNK